MNLPLHRSAEAIGRIDALDAVAKPLAQLVKRAAPPKTLAKDVLSGTWLGHPLHPLLTDIPIGSFTSASVLDLVGGRGAQRAADRLVDLGLLSAVATAAAGAADWSDTHGDDMRTGVVHAAANTVGVALYVWSAVARRRGRRGQATLLGLAGMSVMTVGGYLGGHLSYSRGVGVNNAFVQEPPDEWTPARPLADVPSGDAVRADVDGATALLSRTGDGVVAIGSRCTHAGGPLEEGDIDRAQCTVTCPWHSSVFRLDTGAVVHGPATVPAAAYDTRVVDGMVEVRARR